MAKKVKAVEEPAATSAAAPTIEAGAGIHNPQVPATAPDSITIAVPEGELPAELVEHGELVVRAKQGTRRRAGRAFGPEETAIPIRLLSAGEFDAIAGDPALVITIRVRRSD